MSFEKRFHEIIERVHIPPTSKLWINAFLLSVLCTAICAGYIGLQSGWEGATSLNRAISNAAVIMIGLSLIASSVCYFWDFADHCIVYRKYWGLMGFWLVCIHGLISFAQKDYNLDFFLLEENILPFVAAVVAFLIFAMMAMISNVFSVRKIGGKRWRALLRIGFIAYGFGIYHMLMKAWPQWQQSYHEGILPPLSTFTALFGVTVIILRIALSFALFKKKNQKN